MIPLTAVALERRLSFLPLKSRDPAPKAFNRNVRLPVPVTAGPYYSGSQPTTAGGIPTADLPNYQAKEIADEENMSFAREETKLARRCG